MDKLNHHFIVVLQYFSKPGDTFLSGRRLVLPRLASPGLALPCLVMPCLVLPGFECDAFSSNIRNDIHMVGLFKCVFFTLFTIWLITVNNHMGNIYIFSDILCKNIVLQTIFSDGLVPSVSNDPGTFSNYHIDAWKIWRPFCSRYFEIDFIH